MEKMIDRLYGVKNHRGPYLDPRRPREERQPTLQI